MAKNRDGRNFEGELVWALRELYWFFNKMSGWINEIPQEWDEYLDKIQGVLDEAKERSLESCEPE